MRTSRIGTVRSRVSIDTVMVHLFARLLPGRSGVSSNSMFSERSISARRPTERVRRVCPIDWVRSVVGSRVGSSRHQIMTDVHRSKPSRSPARGFITVSLAESTHRRSDLLWTGPPPMARSPKATHKWWNEHAHNLNVSQSGALKTWKSQKSAAGASIEVKAFYAPKRFPIVRCLSHARFASLNMHKRLRDSVARLSFRSASAATPAAPDCKRADGTAEAATDGLIAKCVRACRVLFYMIADYGEDYAGSVSGVRTRLYSLCIRLSRRLTSVSRLESFQRRERNNPNNNLRTTQVA